MVSNEDKITVNLWCCRKDIAAPIVQDEPPNQLIEWLKTYEVLNLCWLQCLDVAFVFASEQVEDGIFQVIAGMREIFVSSHCFDVGAGAGVVSCLPHQVISFSPSLFPQLVTDSYGSQIWHGVRVVEENIGRICNTLSHRISMGRSRATWNYLERKLVVV